MRQRANLSQWVCGFAAALAAQCVAQLSLADAAPAPRPMVLKAAHLFDSVSGKLSEHGVVVVADGKIVAVGSDASIPANAEVIDLGDATLLPGFIDAHVHLGQEAGPDWYGDFFDGTMRFPAEQALYGAHYAKATLEAGITTVRDLGSADYVALGLRNAIEAGMIPGPRMLVANYAIGATGGHADQDPRCRRSAWPWRARCRGCAMVPKNAAPPCAIRSSSAPTSSSSCPRAACCRCRIRWTIRS